MANSNEIWNLLWRMVLEWREREHDDVKEAVQDDLMAQQTLRECGLYKFWHLESLR